MTGSSTDQRLAAALAAANDELRASGLDVRVAAYRFASGELHIAVIVPSAAGDDDLGEALGELRSGPEPIRAVLNEVFAFVGKKTVAEWQNDHTWRGAMSASHWMSASH